MPNKSEDWQPYFDADEARALIGKRLLVGVTYRSSSDEVISHEQFHGEIIRASEAGGIIVRLSSSGEEKWFPPDLSVLKRAAPGQYNLKSTGESVVDPDFLATWTTYPPHSTNDV